MAKKSLFGWEKPIPETSLHYEPLREKIRAHLIEHRLNPTATAVAAGLERTRLHHFLSNPTATIEADALFAICRLCGIPLGPSDPAPEPAQSEVRPLTLDEARRGLAANYGVAPEAIEISIRGLRGSVVLA